VVTVATERSDRFYKGALAKPIIVRLPPTFWGAVVPRRIAAHQKQLLRHQRATATIIKRQYAKKLRLLFDHYRIADKEDTAALAWALAKVHVPGFKVQFPEAKSKGGRKPKWGFDRLMELYRTVRSIGQQHNSMTGRR
jgi:hypothetical protein